MQRIMIIDDDAQLRVALAVRLRGAHFEVLDSESPEAATPLILQNPPDLILLDIDMPNYSGLDFHECLKFAERARHIPVVYLSGQNSPVFIEAAFRRGARAFIAKPYNPHELVAVLRGVLGADPAPRPVTRPVPVAGV
jgi:two-component system phosphate regulon response regulator PhoB